MTTVTSFTAGDPAEVRLRMLQERGALPAWFEHTRGWAEKFHSEWTSEGWDPNDSMAKVFSPVWGLGPAAGGGPNSPTIIMPANVPVFIRAVFDSLDTAISRSGDENAPLRLSWEGIQAALDRLSQIIGSIRDTGIPMFAGHADPWNSVTIAAAHFCYMHELAHITFQNQNWFQLDEERWVNEFRADELGLVGLVLSYRSHPELLETLALSGPVLSLYFAEIERIAAGNLDQGTSTHPPVRSRIFALREKICIATREGLINGNPLPMADFYAKSLGAFVTILESDNYPIISPVEIFLKNLVRDIRRGNEDRLHAQCNLLLRWFVLGDHQKVFDACHRSLGAIHDDQHDLFDLLQKFVAFAQIYCDSLPGGCDFIEFLNKICLFDREAWESAGEGLLGRP